MSSSSLNANTGLVDIFDKLVELICTGTVVCKEKTKIGGQGRRDGGQSVR